MGAKIESSPQVLITAYPVRGLDINSSYTVYDLLGEQKKQGVAIILYRPKIWTYCSRIESDRIMVLCHGQVTGIVDARTTTKDEIAMLMVGGGKEAQA